MKRKKDWQQRHREKNKEGVNGPEKRGIASGKLSGN
jgi:hypothetical protein